MHCTLYKAINADCIMQEKRLRLLLVHLILPVMTTCYNQARYVSQIHVNTCQCLTVVPHPIVTTLKVETGYNVKHSKGTFCPYLCSQIVHGNSGQTKGSATYQHYDIHQLERVLEMRVGEFIGCSREPISSHLIFW